LSQWLAKAVRSSPVLQGLPSLRWMSLAAAGIRLSFFPAGWGSDGNNKIDA